MSDIVDINTKLRKNARHCESVATVVGALIEPGEVMTLESLCVAYVRAAIEACDGNKSKAAKLLQVSRRALYRWLERGEAA